MAPAPLVLILGSGKNIGAGLATRFASAGYSVAVVSRSGPASPAIDTNGYLQVRADLNNTTEVRSVFATVKAHFKTVPRVVIYNAATITLQSDPSNFFSIPAENLNADLGLMVTSPFVAAAEAVSAWTEAGIKDGRFIYTGNQQARNVLNIPALVTLGVAKSAGYHWVLLADMFYKRSGWR
jgi:NAD(P)-dependent dehydrogenase (short-subunit alcohol dehydrogenase family)